MAANNSGGNPGDLVHVKTWEAGELHITAGDNTGGRATVVPDADPADEARELFVKEMSIQPDGVVLLSDQDCDTATFDTLNMYRTAIPASGALDIDYVDVRANTAFDRRAGSDGWSRTAVGWRAYSTNGVRFLYTWMGDADLDRDVDADDLGRLSGHWQSTVWTTTSGSWSTVWYNGDFTLYSLYHRTTSDDNPVSNESLWFVDIHDLALQNSNWLNDADDLAAWQ